MTGSYTGVHSAYLNEDVVTSVDDKVIYVLLGSRKPTAGHSNNIEQYMIEKFSIFGFEAGTHFIIDDLDGVSKYFVNYLNSAYFKDYWLLKSQIYEKFL